MLQIVWFRNHAKSSNSSGSAGLMSDRRARWGVDEDALDVPLSEPPTAVDAALVEIFEVGYEDRNRGRERRLAVLSER